MILGLLGVWKWLKSLPWQIYAAIGAVLLALFLWHSIDASAYKRGVADQKVLTDQAIAAHRITLTSLKTCRGAVATQNAAVDAMASETARRTTEAEKALKQAQAASVGAEKRAKALEASAGKAGAASACRGSSEFQAAKDGL